MRSYILCLALALLGGLSSCSSVPAMARTSRGEVFEGTGSTTGLGGTYSLYSRQGIMLNGTVRKRQDQAVFKFDLSDGRTGTIPVREVGEASGHGVGRFNNGGRIRFLYGEEAIARYGRSGV